MKGRPSNSVGISGLLGVLFVGLKLTHSIDWSWWWVTLPFWGGLAIMFLIALGYIGFMVITGRR